MIPSVAQHEIQVEAPREQLIGTTSIVDGWPVIYVDTPAKAAIQYRKYVANYSRYSDRPWRVGKNGYASLPNALRALAVKK